RCSAPIIQRRPGDLAVHDIGVRPNAPIVVDTVGDRPYDGFLVGAAGRTYLPSTPLAAVAPVLPNNGRAPRETLILVNGIMTGVALQHRDMQFLANTGARVIGVHNATAGMLYDVAQVLGDKTYLSTNRAIDTVADLLTSALRTGRALHLVGHSQGALIIA